VSKPKANHHANTITQKAPPPAYPPPPTDDTPSSVPRLILPGIIFLVARVGPSFVSVEKETRYETTQHTALLIVVGTTRGLGEVGCFRGAFLGLFGMIFLGEGDKLSSLFGDEMYGRRGGSGGRRRGRGILGCEWHGGRCECGCQFDEKGDDNEREASHVLKYV